MIVLGLDGGALPRGVVVLLPRGVEVLLPRGGLLEVGLGATCSWCTRGLCLRWNQGPSIGPWCMSGSGVGVGVRWGGGTAAAEGLG